MWNLLNSTTTTTIAMAVANNAQTISNNYLHMHTQSAAHSMEHTTHHLQQQQYYGQIFDTTTVIGSLRVVWSFQLFA